MAHSDDIVIVSAIRTPIGRFGGALQDVPATTLGALAIEQALERSRIPRDVVDEVIMGNVLQAGLGQAPARQAAIAAGLPASTCATTINKVCGSGLKSVMVGRNAIATGDARIIVAGGMENMNSAPYLLPKARFGYRMGSAQLVDGMVHDGLWCAIEDKHMGLAAEWIGEHYGIARSEMDEHALDSHMRATAAMRSGAFVDEITPVNHPNANHGSGTVETDECPRSDTNIEKLSRLKPVFLRNGAVTAGNASPIADGAAAVALMRRNTAQELGCAPLVRIIAQTQVAVPPREVFTAPIYAIRKLLDLAGRQADEIGLYEINEAFSSQTVADVRELGLDWERVNVHGGAVALGHPIGASGARVLVTLIHAMRRRQAEVGIAALCIGGGEAVAMLVEAE